MKLEKNILLGIRYLNSLLGTNLDISSFLLNISRILSYEVEKSSTNISISIFMLLYKLKLKCKNPVFCNPR